MGVNSDYGTELGKIPPPSTTPSPLPKTDVEIESIKRTLYNAIDKLDKIQQRRKAALTTT